MSVAFTKEDSAETASETLLPDRPVSPHPNLVTEAGLKALEFQLQQAREAYEAAQKIEAPEGYACGGVCACSTCHVVVKQGLESIPEATDDENDQLDNAPGLTPQSRLACQSVPDGTQDLVVEIPSWNRNLVKEDH